jgi:UPF0716 protein FxsA
VEAAAANPKEHLHSFNSELAVLIVFLILFVTIPLVELYFLIQVGAEFGAIPTIGLSLFTAALGGFLVRRQGFAVLARLRQASDRGETPALEMFDGVLLLAAGLLLLLPGFLTDALGFLLLVPALRQFLIRRVLVALPQGPTPGTRVIEGDYRRERD